jgi:hypothetical protein
VVDGDHAEAIFNKFMAACMKEEDEDATKMTKKRIQNCGRSTELQEN